MEVAHRSLTVSQYLPPISRLEFNSWVRDKSCPFLGKSASYLNNIERNRREVCSALLQDMAAAELLFVHQISFESPKDGIKLPSNVFTEKALYHELGSLLQQQRELNIQTYHSLFHWESQDEVLLLTSLDSMLSFCIITLQLLSLCCYVDSQFTPSCSLQSKFDSLSFSFPPRITISSPLHDSSPAQSESQYQHLLDVLQSAYLGIQSLDQTKTSQQDVIFLLANHRKAIDAAFDAYLHQDESSSSVTESPEEVFEENESHHQAIPQPEKEGVMYIYQGVSTGQPKQLKRELHPVISHADRQLKQQLLREVILLQRQEFDSIPTEIVGETEVVPIETEERVERTIVNFFSFVSKRESNEDVVESSV